MDSVRTTLSGFTGYRFRTGQLSFVLHRLTGLGTLLFLSVHILDTATVYFFPQLYKHAIDLYRGERGAYRHFRPVLAQMVAGGIAEQDRAGYAGGGSRALAAGGVLDGAQPGDQQFQVIHREARRVR
jgi:hypothetical protein